MHEGNEHKPSSVRAILEQIKMFEQHVKPRELFSTFEKSQEHIPLWVQARVWDLCIDWCQGTF